MSAHAPIEEVHHAQRGSLGVVHTEHDPLAAPRRRGRVTSRGLPIAYFVNGLTERVCFAISVHLFPLFRVDIPIARLARGLSSRRVESGADSLCDRRPRTRGSC